MKRFHLHLDLTGVIVTIAVGVLVPVMLSTAVGIVALVLAKDAGGIVTGVLVISFAVTAAGSALITVVLTRKKARLARRQADFVANVSHELRTPLSAIKLYAQTLESGKLAGDAEKMEQCVATIVRETEWLDIMIDKVLTWRASSHDMMQLNMIVQTVSKAVHGAVDRFQHLVAPGEVNLALSDESRRPVKHDVRALHAVVLNLLTNAYKYTGPDKRIQVSVRDEEDDVLIEVSDNGIGISPLDMKRVFEPFYRAGKTAVSDTGGIGLGLAIALYLVNHHHGTIAVKSREGEGSIFSIRLPVVPEAK